LSADPARDAAPEGTVPATEKSVAFVTQGCRLNQFETDSLITRFASRHWQICTDPHQAQVIIINSCTVTNKADRKSHNALSAALRYPHARLVVFTGCGADASTRQHPDDPRILYINNDAKSDSTDIVEAHLAGETYTGLPRGRFGFTPADDGSHIRSVMKIQDGCDAYCSYCIIPFVRGRAQSRPQAAIVEEAKTLIAQGSRELVLSGVNISHWQDQSINASSFSTLVQTLLSLPGDFRIRIASIEPTHLDDSFLSLFSHPKLCPSLHLCLQSGSDRILATMNRHYTSAEFLDIVHRLRSINPQFHIGTDLITGFPGETDAEFQASLALAQEAGFSRMHIFRYSARNGTRSTKLPGQLGEAVKSQRARQAAALGQELSIAWHRGLCGFNDNIIVERESPGPDKSTIAWGHGRYNALTRLCIQPAYGPLRGTSIAAHYNSVSIGEEPWMEASATQSFT